jgi:hypothetical protein
MTVADATPVGSLVTVIVLSLLVLWTARELLAGKRERALEARRQRAAARELRRPKR